MRRELVDFVLSRLVDRVLSMLDIWGRDEKLWWPKEGLPPKLMLYSVIFKFRINLRYLRVGAAC